MARPTFACVLAALGSASLHAQNSHSNCDLPQSTMRINQNVNDDFQQRHRHNHVNTLVDLTKSHDKLAQAGQSLDLSPQVARAVANARQPNLVWKLHHESLSGKSRQEMAGMLQSGKDHMLASQTPIDYEQNQLRVGTHMPPGGRH